jgi:hypothetical protein
MSLFVEIVRKNSAMYGQKIAFVSAHLFYGTRTVLAGHAPSPSRGGLGKPHSLPFKGRVREGMGFSTHFIA